MKNFYRALRHSLKYRFTIISIFLTCLVVALCWGANISVVFPFVEVVFKGDSMHVWVDKQIAEADQQADRLQDQINKLNAQGRTKKRQESEIAGREIALLQSRMTAERQAAARYRQLKPIINRWLPDTAFKTLLLIIGFLVAATIVKNIFLMINQLLVARFSGNLTMDFRNQMYSQIIQSDIATFEARRSGELMHRTTSDVGGTVGGITLLFGKVLREPLKMLVCLAGAAFINWRLTLASLVLAPLAFLLMTRLAKTIKQNSKEVKKEAAKVFNSLSETYHSIAEIKAFGTERLERSRFRKQARNLYGKEMKSTWFGTLVSPCNELMGIGVVALSLLLGGHLVLNQATHVWGIRMTDRGPMSLGALLTFYGFLIGVSDPARKLSGVFASLQGSAVSADRMYQILDEPPQINDPEQPLPMPPVIGDVVFDNVSFHYCRDVPVLRHVDLRIQAGEALAIVGPNGCGKTTLTKLLLRFYDPVEGSVKLGYTDLREVRQRDLRKRIGVVAQHTLLFSGTVMENLRYGTAHASEKDIIEAAQRAHAHKFIMEDLQDGYDSEVGQSGNRLSGGQRQRLALARAILRDPDIFILDEATSQIDPESEQLIHHALSDFLKGRTTIIITHRMATLALADRIMVMNEGRIVDIGTHQELIGRCDLYQRLYHAGFKESA